MQLDLFSSSALIDPGTREGRIVFRALRDCLNNDLPPWWRQVTITGWRRISTDRISPVARISNEDLAQHIIAEVLDLYGHTSTYQIGNWCIGLSYYHEYAQVPEGAKGWDNAWSMHCLANPSQIEWDRRRKAWIPIKAEAA